MSYSKIYNYDDFLSFLSDSGYAESAKKQKDALNASLETRLSEFEAKKKNINRESDELARQAYISYLSASKELPEKLDASGLNGGAADNLYLSLANEYQNNYTDIGRDRQEKLDDMDLEMSKAKLSSDKDYADSMSKLYDSAVDKFLDVRENEEKRKFESYLNDTKLNDNAADRKADAEKEKADRELELAKLAFEAGDSSLLEKLGIKPSGTIGGVAGGAVNGIITGAGGGASSGGLPNAENASDLSKLLDYAVSLAEYGNYDLLCQITGMSKEDAALKFSEEKSGYTDSQIRDAAKLFMSGDYSNNVLGILKEAYPEYTYYQIWKLWESVAENDWMMKINGYRGPKA